MSMARNDTARFQVDPMMVSAYVVTAAVTLLGVAIFFGDQHPYRWLGLALLALFDMMVLMPERVVGPLIRRAPHVYTGVATALIVALVMLPPATPWFVVFFFVISPTVMMVFPRQTGYAWVGVFSALTVVMFLFAEGDRLGNLLQSGLYVAGYFFFAAFATQTARAHDAQRESERLLAELQDAHARLQAYALQAERLAVAEERNRMAREMHDTVGHRLTAAAVQLQAVERLAASDPGRAAGMAATAREQVREALADLRATVATLRAAPEEGMTLETALPRLVADFSAATTLRSDLRLPDDLPDLPSAYRHTFYRAAQEALTNAQKHAQATKVEIALAQEGDAWVLRVADNGCGPRAASGQGFGLLGLRERAQLLGGAVAFGERAAGGSELVVSLPVKGQS
jgi:signal transduction histidine kinase